MVKLCFSKYIFLYFNSLAEKLCLSLLVLYKSHLHTLAYIPDGSHSLTVWEISNTYFWIVWNSHLNKECTLICLGEYMKIFIFTLSFLTSIKISIFSYIIIHKLKKMSHVSLYKTHYSNISINSCNCYRFFLKYKKV